MRTSNFIVSPILLVRYLFIVTSAVLIFFGLITFARQNASLELAPIYTAYGILMFGDALAMLIFGLFINRAQKHIYWLAVMAVFLNVIAAIFDQAGVIDFLFSLINAMILCILLTFRKEFII